MKSEPVTFSMAFGIEGSEVDRHGAIDVTLNCDTHLFLDPLLLQESAHTGFGTCAHNTYVAHFEAIIDLLSQSNEEGDFAWRNAERLLTFPEVKQTHLGYSGSERGSGSGPHIRASLMRNSRDAINLGIRNPDLFLVLSLFEEGIGADRISDMVTRIILPCLCEFTGQVSRELGIPCREFQIANNTYFLPENPLSQTGESIILVPNDIVRDLPTASDWDSVASAARETELIRERTSRSIGEIWSAKTRSQKDDLRRSLLTRREAFQEFIDLLNRSVKAPYNVKEDHLGEIYPADLRRSIAASSPLDLSAYGGRPLRQEEVADIVNAIVAHFRTLIESNGLWELLYDDDRSTPRRERAAQRLFFAIARAYCDANNLDLSPEADSGCGPVDFKISNGSQSKIIVELKKSTNRNLVDSYSTQVSAYAAAESPFASHYVVLDVGQLTPLKRARLSDAQQGADPRYPTPRLWFIDATPRPSASHR